MSGEHKKKTLFFKVHTLYCTAPVTRDPKMSNSDDDENAVENAQNGELDKIAEIFVKVKDFLEAGEFNFGPLPPNQPGTPVRRSALSIWKSYYKSLVMKPGHTMQKLYPALDQCEAVETEVLKTEKSHLVRQLHVI